MATGDKDFDQEASESLKYFPVHRSSTSRPSAGGSKPDANPLLKWTLQNLFYILPVALVGVAGLRLFISSGGDDATLKVLAEHLNVSAILFASFLQVLPDIVLLSGFYLVIEYMYERKTGDRGYATRSVRLVIIILIVSGILLSPVSHLAETLIIWCILLGYQWIRLSNIQQKGHKPYLAPGTLAIWIMVAIIYDTICYTSMWLPTELLSFKDGVKTVGYVISADDQLTTILSRDKKDVFYMRSDEISSRTLCSGQDRNRPIITYLPWVALHIGQSGNGTDRCPVKLSAVKPRPAQVPPIPTNTFDKPVSGLPARLHQSNHLVLGGERGWFDGLIPAEDKEAVTRFCIWTGHALPRANHAFLGTWRLPGFPTGVPLPPPVPVAGVHPLWG